MNENDKKPAVLSLSRSKRHEFSKTVTTQIRLLAGIGIEGDAHAGRSVKHRSRVAKEPTQPNLRQVHLIHNELLVALRAAGFEVQPGDLGENVTTRNIDLLSLPTGTLLRLGSDATIEITGLRNPCAQLDNFQRGLTAAVLGRDGQGNLVRKAGIMAIVISGGVVATGDEIVCTVPAKPHSHLQPV